MADASNLIHVCFEADSVKGLLHNCMGESEDKKQAIIVTIDSNGDLDLWATMGISAGELAISGLKISDMALAKLEGKIL